MLYNVPESKVSNAFIGGEKGMELFHGSTALDCYATSFIVIKSFIIW